jgi:hypothetical protein
MNQLRDNHLPTDPTPRFPWNHVVLTALIVLALVGLIVLIRRGGGAALAAAVPAVALSVGRASRRSPGSRIRGKEPIDMEFLKAQLREGAMEKAIVTPTELKLVLNGLFEKNNLHPPFESEQQLAKVLSPLGLHSAVRMVPGRSERRWYDLTGYGTHEAPAQ